MKKLIALFFAVALSVATSTAVFADDPHAGNSGHFHGSEKQCDGSHPLCPPFGK